MKIQVIAVGKLKEKFWVQACDEYLKRLQAYAKVSVVEIPDRDPAKSGGEAAAVEAEGRAICEKISAQTHVVLLAIDGKELSSEKISARMDALALGGESDITFVIGGSCGTSDEVCTRADEKWSFGPITLPHNLARVVLLEQVYRGFKISRGEPYHK